MKAAVLYGGGDLRYESAPDPAPGQGEVVVEVRACAICGSDLHAFHGKHPRLTFPRILGHEFSGEVVALGPGVEGVRLGQRVCCDIDVFCGQCGPCHEGRTNLCEHLKTTGFDRDGAYARYVTVPAFNLFPLPENVTYDQAAAIQALGISYHAVAHRARARPRERIAVIGAGPVGLGAGLIAQLLGAEVTITDVLEYRLAKARELGIASTLDANSADLHARALELTEGRGFDKVIECVGGAQERTVADAAALVKRGGQITIVGTFPENRASIPIAHLKDREIDINFSRGNFQAFGPCLELVARRMLDPNRYISHRFPLSEAKEALQLLEARNAAVHKVVLRPCDDG